MFYKENWKHCDNKFKKELHTKCMQGSCTGEIEISDFLIKSNELGLITQFDTIGMVIGKVFRHHLN